MRRSFSLATKAEFTESEQCILRELAPWKSKESKVMARVLFSHHVTLTIAQMSEWKLEIFLKDCFISVISGEKPSN